MFEVSVPSLASGVTGVGVVVVVLFPSLAAASVVATAVRVLPQSKGALLDPQRCVEQWRLRSR